MDAIYLSNHGGRQLDHGPGVLDVLEDVVSQIDIPVPLIVDGGFYRGSDIVKAIAMGADGGTWSPRSLGAGRGWR